MPKERKTTIQHATPMTKRQRARWEEEQSRQKRVLFAVGGIIGAVVLLLALGLVWDKVFVPNRTVASYSGGEILNGEYQDFRVIAQAQRAYNNYNQQLQFQQFGATSGLDTSIETDFLELGDPNAPIDYEILNELIDSRLIKAAAETEGLTIDDAAVIERLSNRISPPAQPQPTPVISGTETLTGTDALSNTETISEPVPTATPAPTSTPTAQELNARLESGLQTYYENLRNFIQTPPAPYVGVEIPFSYQEFRDFVIDREREVSLREQMGEKLVSEDEAPKTVYADADQIFIKVTTTPTDTAEISATLWAEGEERINEIADDLEDGADFDTLMATVSDFEETTVYDGMQPISVWSTLEITEPISNQEVGVIGEPFRSSQGWHLVRVNEREERPDESALGTLRGEKIAEWVDGLRAAAAIEYFPAPTPTPPPPTLDPTLFPPTPAAEATPPPAEATPTP